MKRILITGATGFIGHHLVDYILSKTAYEVVALDRMSFAGSMSRLADLRSVSENSKRISWRWHDLRAPISELLAEQIGHVDIILHLAASSHVDRSIADPIGFVMDNTLGTAHLLDYARRLCGLERFLYFSTDEVFGPAPVGVAYREWDRYHSANPYAASKAGAEELCLAFRNTYGLPVIVTHTMNVFGERQHPEKYIPMTVKKVCDGGNVIVHSSRDRKRPGSRFYIHAQDVASAVMFLLSRGQPGEKYNIVGEREVDNLILAKMIADTCHRPLRYELVDFHSSRPGHDLRYALDGSRLAAMGWRHGASFPESLEKTVRWYLDNPQWLFCGHVRQEVAA
jgi:dTDP-glucose 4,6-dehydratase